jgi:hypothetical protein
MTTLVHLYRFFAGFPANKSSTFFLSMKMTSLVLFQKMVYIWRGHTQKTEPNTGEETGVALYQPAEMTKWCHLGDSDSADTTRLQHLQAMSSLEFLLFCSTGFLHPTWSAHDRSSMQASRATVRVIHPTLRKAVFIHCDVCKLE